MRPEDVILPEDALSESFLAATGPGGQNVNKVATAVQLRVDLFKLGLHPAAYERLREIAGSKVTGGGELLITARRFRTQDANRTDVNWAGFYRNVDGELVLGPFQGRAACIRIAFGSGVCGTAAATRETQLIEDVHAFPGHIACDSASNSEIVVPLLRDGALIGVLDIDSPVTGRFNEEDRAGCERLGEILSRVL